ncbi:class I SAM-dependent methyltransferase [Stappia indica]|uniref:Methyltransferase domain-containing protein n=1 Tax=Stappia indica TaxID=538381 RepID=A0A857C682_9HYPH|nr:class I SAM-dependent methyltransferase [Stappia indica]QGZ34536.1 methyltransferase domain-containing protein [Stappia indica]
MSKPETVPQTGERLLAILTERKARKVLDIGCGHGALSRSLAAKGFETTGIDPDAAAVAAARKAVPDARFERATAEALPFADGSFDAAIFLNALHHVPEAVMRQALAETRRVIGPGGALIVVEPLARGTFFEVMRPVEDETEIRAAALRALDADIASGKWHVARHDTYDRLSDFAALEEFIDYLVAVDPTRKSVANERREELDALFKANATASEKGFRLIQPLTLYELHPAG